MIRILYLVLPVVVFVAGCGYKGPLVLPEKAVTVNKSVSESNSDSVKKDTKQKLP